MDEVGKAQTSQWIGYNAELSFKDQIFFFLFQILNSVKLHPANMGLKNRMTTEKWRLLL